MKTITFEKEDINVLLKILDKELSERLSIGWQDGGQKVLSIVKLIVDGPDDEHTALPYPQMAARLKHVEGMLGKIERQEAQFDSLCQAELDRIGQTLSAERHGDERLSGTVARILAECGAMHIELGKIKESLKYLRAQREPISACLERVMKDRALAWTERESLGKELDKLKKEAMELQAEFEQEERERINARAKLDAIRGLGVGHPEDLVEAVKTVVDHRNEMSLALENLIGDADDIGNGYYRITKAHYNRACVAYENEESESLRAKLAKSEHARVELQELVYKIRPMSDCYERILKRLGIPNDVIGFVCRLTTHRDLLLDACQAFVDKCDAGTARSVRSYKQMKEAIAYPNQFKEAVDQGELAPVRALSPETLKRKEEMLQQLRASGEKATFPYPVVWSFPKALDEELRGVLNRYKELLENLVYDPEELEIVNDLLNGKPL